MNGQNNKYDLIVPGIALSGMLVVGAVIGSLQGLWLSSRVLSPLVAGGVLGFVISALVSTFFTLILAKLGEVDVKEAALKSVTYTVAWAVTSGLIGVGLGFAANAIFPGVMLATGSPALVGAVIGAITLTVGLSALEYVITPLAKKVNGYIISPVIECFASKEKEDDSSLCCNK